MIGLSLGAGAAMALHPVLHWRAWVYCLTLGQVDPAPPCRRLAPALQIRRDWSAEPGDPGEAL